MAAEIASAGAEAAVDGGAAVGVAEVCDQGHAAAIAGAVGRGIRAEAAGLADRTAGLQHDASTVLPHPVGFDAAAVDDAARQLVGGARRQNDLPVRRLDGLAVFDQGRELTGCDGEALQLGERPEVQRDGFAARQRDRALPRKQNAAVAHLGREQGDVAADARPDAAVVHHRTVRAIALEGRSAVHEVGIAHLVRGGDQSADIHIGAGCKVHTGWIQ